MAVHAHPDDESSKGAATMARYAAEGVSVLVVTLTGGERGDVLNKAMDRPGIRDNLVAVRRQEMARASAILGVGHLFLGFVDSGLPAGGRAGDTPPPLPEGCFALQPVEVATAALVRAVRSFRPHVMITYDPTGGYPHPDHIMCHRVSAAAFDAAGDPGRCHGAGPAWQPLKLYYHSSFNCGRIRAMHAEAERRGVESPFGGEFSPFAEEIGAFSGETSASGRPLTGPNGAGGPRPLLAVTTRVACADYFVTRDRALRAHATQVDPNGFWTTLPVEVQQAEWPTEDFYLARSLVGAALPEDDLFAGVRAGSPTAHQGAAIDLDHLPGDEASIRACQMHHGGGDLADIAAPAHRGLSCTARVEVWRHPFAVELRARDVAGRDHVNRDALGRKPERKRRRPRVQGGLRPAVRRRAAEGRD
jgi:mycothiol S-conjugate amidase